MRFPCRKNATIAGLDHEEVCTGDGTGRVGGVGDAAHKWLHLRQLKRLMQLLTMSAMLRSLCCRPFFALSSALYRCLTPSCHGDVLHPCRMVHLACTTYRCLLFVWCQDCQNCRHYCLSTWQRAWTTQASADALSSFTSVVAGCTCAYASIPSCSR